MSQTIMTSASLTSTVMGSGSMAVTEVVNQPKVTKMTPDALELSVNPSSNRRRGRRRFEEIPIFARSCLESSPPASRHPGPFTEDRFFIRKATPSSQNPSTITRDQSLLGEATPPPKASDSGLLGHWEDSITNSIPSEEPIIHLSAFICEHVVGGVNIDADLAAFGPGAGAFIEVEAKIGHFIDKNTNSRLRLPVTGEHVLDKSSPNLRFTFQSSITDTVARSMNTLLNNAHHHSQKPRRRPATPDAKPRHAMRYLHTRECDVYYDLSTAGLLSLPLAVRRMFNARHYNAKLRVTFDQHTGNTIAQIIKVRIADLDVYSPNTEFDYRVSVNLEAKVEGDWRKLVEPNALKTEKFERDKDRVSFRHLAYSIDLTSVFSPNVYSPNVNELEVEVFGMAIRKHGILFRDGQPNGFNKLVEGFANNIRIMAKGPDKQPCRPWERKTVESAVSRREAYIRQQKSEGNWCYLHETAFNLCYNPRFCKRDQRFGENRP